jgi:hypothetical protein
MEFRRAGVARARARPWIWVVGQGLGVLGLGLSPPAGAVLTLLVDFLI